MFELDAETYIRSWKLLAVRGVVTAAFGLLAMLWPGATVMALVMLVGALAFLRGVLTLFDILSGEVSANQRWLALLEAGIGILIGLVAFFFPRITVGTLLFIIAVWVVVLGASQLAAALSLRAEIAHAWLLGLAGLLSISIGVIFMTFPIRAAASIAVLFGIFLFVIGASMAIFALRLRELAYYDDTLTEHPS